MITGIGYPSFSKGLVWSAPMAHADYPGSNLADLERPSKPTRFVGSMPEGVYMNAVFPQSLPIGFIAIVAHNAPPGATFNIWLGNDTDPYPTGPDVVFAGSYAFWPNGSAAIEGYPSIRPVVLPAPVMARSIWISCYGVTAPFDIGAIDVAYWWGWDGISPGKDLAVDARGAETPLVGGVSSVADWRTLRQVSGQVDYMKVGGKTNTVLDFQREMDLDRAFVFVQDYETPATWPRTTLLAKNLQVPPLTGALYKHDRFVFRFGEHWR